MKRYSCKRTRGAGRGDRAAVDERNVVSLAGRRCQSRGVDKPPYPAPGPTLADTILAAKRHLQRSRVRMAAAEEVLIGAYRAIAREERQHAEREATGRRCCSKPPPRPPDCLRLGLGSAMAQHTLV